MGRAWWWSPSSPSVLYIRERTSLPFYFLPLRSREAGNHGPEVGSDFIVGLRVWERVRLHFNATWLEFSTFPFTKFYLISQKFPQFHKSFLQPCNLNKCVIKISFPFKRTQPNSTQ